MSAQRKYDLYEVERRIWEMMDQGLTTFEIIDRLDMPPLEAMGVIRGLVKRRGTPRLEAAAEAIEQLRAIRF